MTEEEDCLNCAWKFYCPGSANILSVFVKKCHLYLAGHVADFFLQVMCHFLGSRYF